MLYLHILLLTIHVALLIECYLNSHLDIEDTMNADNICLWMSNCPYMHAAYGKNITDCLELDLVDF